MSKAKVMIVEDESIIAEDIADSLKSIGYSIVGIVSSGEEGDHDGIVSFDTLVREERSKRRQ